jgi:hypothetical protein
MVEVVMARRLLCIAIAVAVLGALTQPRSPADEHTPRKVAFLVGVSKYDHDFPDLQFAERDVEALKTTLADGGFEVVLLIGSGAGKDRATKKNVESRLADLLAGGGDENKTIRKGDLVLVALSGHGLQMRVPDPANPAQTREDAFFCPVNAKRNDPSSLVSLSHLLDDLLAPNGGRNLLLVDACRDIADPNKGKGIEGRDMALKGETAVLFSCGRGERSWENANLKHGLFTHAVLKGLRDEVSARGVVTWSSLVSHVQDEMASDEFKKLVPEGYTQTPIPTSGQMPRTVLLAGKVPDRVIPRPIEAERAQGPTGKTVTLDLGGGVTMEFVRIPAGSFTMGSPASEDKHGYDEDQHPVRISKDFYLGKYPVTQAQYEAVIGTNPSYSAPAAAARKRSTAWTRAASRSNRCRGKMPWPSARSCRGGRARR